MQIPITKADSYISSRIYKVLRAHIRYLDGFLEELNFITDFIVYVILFILVITRHFISIPLAIIVYESSVFIQRFFERKRPYEVFNIIHSNYSAKGHSFPSSHSAVSIFLLLYYFNLPVIWILIIVPILRIITLNHWLTDILGGALIGILFFAGIKFFLPIFIKVFKYYLNSLFYG